MGVVLKRCGRRRKTDVECNKEMFKDMQVNKDEKGWEQLWEAMDEWIKEPSQKKMGEINRFRKGRIFLVPVVAHSYVSRE